MTSVAMCTPCVAGKYCPSLNMTGNGPDCHPGHYCTGSSPVPDPVNQTYGDICPRGDKQKYNLFI